MWDIDKGRLPKKMTASVLSLISKFLTGFRGSLRSSLVHFRQRNLESKSVVACVFSTGERTEKQCLASIRSQTNPVSRLELIRDVEPISAASNRALDLARDADLLLWVDADMILYPRCNEHLLRLMTSDTLYAVAPLLDPVFGKVGYIKLLNMHIVRKLDLHFRDTLGCDVDFCRQTQERDPSVALEAYTLSRRPLGLHHPTYTARELFRKNQIEKKKRGNKVDPRLLSMLAQKHLQSPSPVLLAGILGEILPNPDTSEGESTPQSGLHHWNKVNELLGNISDEVIFGFPDYTLQESGD